MRQRFWEKENAYESLKEKKSAEWYNREKNFMINNKPTWNIQLYDTEKAGVSSSEVISNDNQANHNNNSALSDNQRNHNKSAIMLDKVIVLLYNYLIF